MQTGDRILSVNGCKSTSFAPLFQQPLHEFLGPEVKNACIKVEFDITDSVVPTSGEFTVKLLKNDHRSLGITITGKTPVFHTYIPRTSFILPAVVEDFRVWFV